MFERGRALGAAIAVIVAAVAGVLIAAPAFAMSPASQNSIVIVAAVGAAPPSLAGAATIPAVPLPAAATVAVDDSTAPRVVEEPAKTDSPVAEQRGGTVTPLIMVAGLALLFASIFLVIRSGSSQRSDPTD